MRAAIKTVCLIMCFTCLSDESCEALQVRTAVVEGKVKNAITGERVANARVEVRTAETSLLVYAVQSSTDGSFHFPSVRSGHYKVSASAPGYLSAEYGPKRLHGANVALNLSDSDRLANLEIALTPAGVISGTVLDSSGQPVVLGDVFLLQAVQQEGGRVLRPVLSSKTDDQGSFRIFWISPGTYFLSVVSGSGTDSSMIINQYGADTINNFALSRISYGKPLVAPPPTTESFVPTFFPGTLQPQRAQPIEVKPGSETRLSLIVLTFPSFRVSGTIINGVPEQVPAAVPSFARLVPLESGLPGYSGQIDAVTNKFEIARVPPGDYVLYIQMRRSAQSTAADALWGSMKLGVQDRDLTDLRLVASPAITVKGRIVVDSAQHNLDPAVAAGLSILLRPDPLVTQQAPSPTAQVTTNGEFTFTGIPGHYRVYVVPLLNPSNPELVSARPPLSPRLAEIGAYVKSIHVGGIEALDSGISLRANENQSMDIIIGTSPGAITGRVVKSSNGQALSDALINVFASSQASMEFRLDMQRSAVTDQLGTFKLEGLPPGDYLVFAWDGGGPQEGSDLEFALRHRELGTSVRVGEGVMTTLTLSAIDLSN